MASIKTKLRSKPHPGKLKGKARKAVDLEDIDDEDKTEREDSGVHFDEPVLPPSSNEEATTKTKSNVRAALRKLMSAGSTSKSIDQLSVDYGDANSSSSSNCENATRVSKSESPRIKNGKERTYAAETAALARKTTLLKSKQKTIDVASWSEVIPGAGDSFPQRPRFVLYASDNESDGDDSEHRSPVAPLPSVPAKSVRERERERSRARFRRMLRPLRRSHSAGCSQDVPVHALFLRHDVTKLKSLKGQRSVDAARSSMDRLSSSSDTDEPTAGDKKALSGSLKTKKKSLAKDVKEKLSFLRRRHTDTALSSKDTKYKTTPDDALHWSKSFDHLLMDKQGLDLFREFLRTEFSEENIEFWIACEDYKNVHSNKLNNEAQRIYTDFIAVQAPHEINLDSKTRMSTISNISSPNRLTFEGAQRRIQALMEKDSYRRFLHSDIYQDLLGGHRANFSPP